MSTKNATEVIASVMVGLGALGLEVPKILFMTNSLFVYIIKSKQTWL